MKTTLKPTVIARNEAISELYRLGRRKTVVLNGEKGLFSHTLRQAQVDNVLLSLFVILFFLFLSVSSRAQGADTVHNSSNNVHKAQFERRKPLIVIDGVIFSYDSLKSLSPANIISIDTLKYSAREGLYPNTPTDVIIYITKRGAIKSYQKKFSGFSKEYKAYLEAHQYNDLDFLYVLNGVPADEKLNDGIKKLNDIQSKKIKKVIFKDKDSNVGNIVPIVIITIKQ